ncbi:MAG: DUF6514 family protein [Oscillospiraceae bacterium]|nr:DUF6514 family protein [Oscillospiraceae bacterium]
MVTYKVIECKGLSTYGIIAVDSDEIIEEIPDISANKEAIIGLANRMNHDRLSLIHFCDVVEDFLISEY